MFLADSNQYPITVGLSDLLASTPSFNPAVGGGGQSVKIFKPELALATLLAVVPVAIVFLFSQRALVRGSSAAVSKVDGPRPPRGARPRIRPAGRTALVSAALEAESEVGGAIEALGRSFQGPPRGPGRPRRVYDLVTQLREAQLHLDSG